MTGLRFTTRPVFGRRNFLSGLGVAGLALHPLVRAIMKSEEAFAVGPADTARLVIIPIQVGWGARRNGPLAQESDFAAAGYFRNDAQGNLVLPPYFSPLSAFRPKMNCFDGFMGTWWGNAHDVSFSDNLTNFATPGNREFTPSTSESIDALIAAAWNTGVIRASQGSYWSKDLECWVRNGNVVSKALPFRDPSASFGAMVGLLPAPQATPTAQPGTTYDRKQLLMDFVSEDLGKIKARVPATAFEALQAHLSTLEALQGTLPGTPPVVVDGGQCVAPSAPGTYREGNSLAGTALDIETAVRAHFQIIRAGLACGTHRVAMMALPNGFSPTRPDNWTWTDSMGDERTGNIWSGNFHEDVTHWNKTEGAQDRRLAYEGSIKIRVQWVAEFIASLAAVQYGDGSTLLDKTLVVLTGEVADGTHNTRIKPMITIGGGAFVRTGRHVQVPWLTRGPTMADAQTLMLPAEASDWRLPFSLSTEGDWWMGVARALGVNLTSFGNPSRLWRRFDLPPA